MSFADGAPLEDRLPKVTFVIFQISEDPDGRLIKTPTGVAFTNPTEADAYVDSNTDKEVVPVHTFTTATLARNFNIDNVRREALAKLMPIEVLALGLDPSLLAEPRPKKPVTRNRGV